MNWEAIGAIGEIVGAAAVVFSLVYLSIQIRTQSAESRISAMHDIAVGFRENIASFSDRELAEIIIKGNQDISSLNEVERVRLISAGQRLLRLWEEAFAMHQKGRLEAGVWDPMVRQYKSIMGGVCFQFIWSMRKEYYNDDFRKFVDSLDTIEWKV
jgi:hypothetical protein